jgi:hypothetical protein
MVNHQVVDLHPATAVTVNAHEPVIVHNVTARVMRMSCNTCFWVGPSRTGRSLDRVEDDWRTHASDLAMGATITHGQADNGCHFAACAQANRATCHALTQQERR